jgi:hypothetical protein
MAHNKSRQQSRPRLPPTATHMLIGIAPLKQHPFPHFSVPAHVPFIQSPTPPTDWHCSSVSYTQVYVKGNLLPVTLHVPWQHLPPQTMRLRLRIGSGQGCLWQTGGNGGGGPIPQINLGERGWDVTTGRRIVKRYDRRKMLKKSRSWAIGFWIRRYLARARGSWDNVSLCRKRIPRLILYLATAKCITIEYKYALPSLTCEKFSNLDRGSAAKNSESHDKVYLST